MLVNLSLRFFVIVVNRLAMRKSARAHAILLMGASAQFVWLRRSRTSTLFGQFLCAHDAGQFVVALVRARVHLHCMHTNLELIVCPARGSLFWSCASLMMLSNVGEWPIQAQVAHTDIGVMAWHLIVRSLAQILIRISNGNTWRLHCASQLTIANWSLMYLGIVAPVRRKNVPPWRKQEGSAEATATRQIHRIRAVKSLTGSENSPRAKVQKEKKAKVKKKIRRTNLNPQCRWTSSWPGRQRPFGIANVRRSYFTNSGSAEHCLDVE